MGVNAVAAHFEGKAPIVRDIYDRLLETAARFGPVREDPKKTSIHLTRRTAFAGVATQRKAIILTLKSPADVPSDRIMRREQASAKRWYLYLKLTDPKQIDRQVSGWIKRSMDLCD